MQLHKSTRYALHAALELTQRGVRSTTVKQIAARYELPENVMAKVLQQLVRAGIASGVRGVGGGYRLARPAAEVSVQDLIDIFEPPPQPTACVLRTPACRLLDLFDEVDETVRSTFASVSLATLASPVPESS